MSRNYFKSFSKTDDQIISTVFVLCCAFVAVALPFSIRFTSKAILLLSAVWLFHVNRKDLMASLKNRWFLLYVVPCMLLLVSLLYTEDIKSGLWELEKATPLLVLPFLLCSVRPFKLHETQFILRSFIFSNLLFGICVLSYATYRYATEGVNLYHNFDLVRIFESHPTYYSMYVLFSMAALFYLHKEGVRRTIVEKNKLLIGLITVFFSILIFLSSIRFIFLIYVLGCIVLVCVYTIKTKNIKKGIVLFLGLFALVSIVLSTNSILRERFIQVQESYRYQLSPETQEGYNGFTTRLAQWESSRSIIAEAPIFGVGPGDVQARLQEAYKKNFLKYSYRDRLNAHNQYIQTTLGLGIVGLLAFLATLILPAILAIRRRNYIALIFLILFSTCCITESMLYVHKGIVFFSFFSSLFTFHMLTRPKSEPSADS